MLISAWLQWDLCLLFFVVFFYFCRALDAICLSGLSPFVISLKRKSKSSRGQENYIFAACWCCFGLQTLWRLRSSCSWVWLPFTLRQMGSARRASRRRLAAVFIELWTSAGTVALVVEQRSAMLHPADLKVQRPRSARAKWFSRQKTSSREFVIKQDVLSSQGWGFI